MKPFEILGSAETHDGQKLTLHRRDGGFFIFLDGEELMATRAPGSERALADLGCEDLPSKQPRVLIGGLGLGFTLKAALDTLPSQATVVVSEAFDAVIEWNRTFLKDLQGGALQDRRVSIAQGDVWDQLEEPGSFDSILLDVDNGPSAWCLESNGRLYDRTGLERIRRALRPGGVLAVWSAYPGPAFVKLLKKRGFEAKSHRARSHGGKGNRHTIFVARVPQSGRPGAKSVSGAGRARHSPRKSSGSPARRRSR
ncbi:MAG: hypothetical protein K0U98_21080 [Deltaproteobacteria bacterium]|nr:hypothetical protein [Deltaproteobacteria bacterium]